MVSVLTISLIRYEAYYVYMQERIMMMRRRREREGA